MLALSHLRRGRKYWKLFAGGKIRFVDTRKPGWQELVRTHPKGIIFIGDHTNKLLAEVQELTQAPVFLHHPQVALVSAQRSAAEDLKVLESLGYQLIQWIGTTELERIAWLHPDTLVIVKDEQLYERLIRRYPQRNIILRPEVPFEILPSVLQEVISDYLPVESISPLLEQSLAKDYWQRRVCAEFGVSKKELAQSKLTPKERYVQLLTLSGGLTSGSEHYLGVSETLEQAIRNHQTELLIYLLTSYPEQVIDSALLSRVVTKDTERLKLLITLGVQPADLVCALKTQAPSALGWFLDHYGDRLSGLHKREAQLWRGIVEGDIKVIQQFLKRHDLATGLGIALKADQLKSVLFILQIDPGFLQDAARMISEASPSMLRALDQHFDSSWYGLFGEQARIGQAVKQGDFQEITKILEQSDYREGLEEITYLQALHDRNSDLLRYLVSLPRIIETQFFNYTVTEVPLLVRKEFIAVMSEQTLWEELDLLAEQNDIITLYLISQRSALPRDYVTLY